MISRIITLSKSTFLRFILLGSALAFTQEPFNLPYCNFLVLPLISFLVMRFLKTSKQYLFGGLGLGLGYFGLTFVWIVNPFLVDLQKDVWLAPFAY
ncbi:MAG: apolipoprotein N-acyltransferase, partial [Alphaproteobacteria bacterium]